eukprot:m.13339 g.13339  ORF g.13339 m.13339 type:complete len:266 (+) comp24696_c0_seq1:1182-1979(+)
MTFSFSHSSFLLITGASQGYGRSLAILFAQKFFEASPSTVRIVLTARSADGLEETKQLIAKHAPGLDVSVLAGDFAQTNGGEGDLSEKLLRSVESKTYEQVILINNAGSLGNIAVPLSEQADLNHLQEYFLLNVGAPIVLTSNFLKVFHQTQRKYVLNISSLCALVPFESLGLYCSGKAARDMAFRVLAKENATVRVLNWAPGPMGTAMTGKIIEEAYSEDIRKTYKGMAEQSKFVSTEESVLKLIGLLIKDEFESGSHIDIYDV